MWIGALFVVTLSCFHEITRRKMMENISVALCIVTYERSNIVQDFLINCSAYYIQAGIDIYYYDSSVSDKTESVVCNWPDQDHIYYIRMPSEMRPSTKVYKIFQGYGLRKDYDFIWLSNDGLQCSSPAIEHLMSNLSLEYDIVEPCHTDRENIGTKIFTDPNEYMQMCAWHLTLFGATLLNSHTMLNNVDWACYENKFLVPGMVFSHVRFYFNRILELEQFHALFLSLPHSMIRESKLKKDIGWRKRFFFVLCEDWVRTIENLPEIYTGKKTSCVKFGDLFVLRKSELFYHFRSSGLYSFNVYWKYRDAWEKVTSLPKSKLLLAALTPKSLISLNRERNVHIGLSKLKKFCSTHPRVVIFGTGVTGEIYDKYFKESGLSYEAFCVSHRKPNKKDFLNHPIYELDEIKKYPGDIGIVVALIDENAKEVLSVLQDIFGDSCIFYDSRFIESARRKVGYAY